MGRTPFGPTTGRMPFGPTCAANPLDGTFRCVVEQIFRSPQSLAISEGPKRKAGAAAGSS